MITPKIIKTEYTVINPVKPPTFKIDGDRNATNITIAASIIDKIPHNIL